jgi:hypothetical protein
MRQAHAARATGWAAPQAAGTPESWQLTRAIQPPTPAPQSNTEPRTQPTTTRRGAVISSPDLGVFAVAAAGVLCGFWRVAHALSAQCLRRRPSA